VEEYPIDFITLDATMDAPMTKAALAKMEIQTVTEMQENMRLNRRNRGLDSIFDLSKEMKDYCDKFLTIHEEMRRLDYDVCPLWGKPEESWTPDMQYVFKLMDERRPFNKWGSAFESDALYVNAQQEAWHKVFDLVAEFRALKAEFPSKRGKDFDGFPVHFATSDRDDMRRYLMELDAYNGILNDDKEGTIFVVHCKMWGLLNAIPSVWLYFGRHYPSKSSLTL
jgi:hypothetical protein